MKVCFETFGCRLNKAEALQMEAEYLAKGWELTENHSDADLFVVRGCSVTARAQSDCEKLIAHLRRRYPETPLRVCGCLKIGEAESFPPQKLKEEFRFLSRSGQESASPLPVRTARAYLKVQDGCNGKCTFCIVPKFRGNSVSAPFTELLDKAKRFIDSGYHEIVVTGCNLSLYSSEGKRLPELLESLAELSTPPKSGQESASPPCRIRIGSLEPGDCALDVVDVVAEHGNICRFLHIPFQTGSAHLLMSMKRPYRLRDVDNLINSAVRKIPGLGLGCDLMTGFPGETELDFETTVRFLSRHPFNNAHVFPYSERPGTPATRLHDSVPKALRSLRAHQLSETIAANRMRFAYSFLDKTVEIIAEENDRSVGWTGEYLWCTAMGTAPRKSLVRVRVTAVNGDRLSGHVV